MHKILHPEDLPMIDCYKGLIPEMPSIGNVHQTKTSHQRVYISKVYLSIDSMKRPFTSLCVLAILIETLDM